MPSPGAASLPRQKSDAPQPDFPAGIDRPATGALIFAGYTRLEQLTALTEAELLAMHGLGPKALGVLKNALSARGLAFAPPAPAKQRK